MMNAVAPSTYGSGKGGAPRQQKATARRNNQKELTPKKAFQPYHAIRVPKEADLGTTSQQSTVEEPVTTLMLRNIPNKYTQTVLLQEIDKLGFAGTYDFFYLPMDVHNRSNVGYAFINFVHPASATHCIAKFSNYKFQRYHSKKICAVSPAHLQGFEKNVKHFQHRAVMNARDNQYRPVVLRGGAQAQSQTLELDKALENGVPDFPNGLPISDFSDCYVPEQCLLETEPFDYVKSEDSFALPQWLAGITEFTQDEKILPDDMIRQDENMERNSQHLPSLQEALSELLRNSNGYRAANSGLGPSVRTADNYSCKVDSMLRIDTPPEKVDFGLTSFVPKFSSSLDCEDPEWIVPQGGLKTPPGLTLDKPAIGRTQSPKSFEPNDKTPRTNHSLLGGCFGPTNGPLSPAWGPGWM
jgi:hypothetical protein